MPLTFKVIKPSEKFETDVIELLDYDQRIMPFIILEISDVMNRDEYVYGPNSVRIETNMKRS